MGKFKADDDAQRERVDAKNKLESYAYSMKQTVEDDKVKDKISDEDKATVVAKVDEVISWLDSNQTAEKDEFEAQQKELEGVCTPIIKKMYEAGGMPEGGIPVGMPGGMPDMGGAAGGAAPGAGAG